MIRERKETRTDTFKYSTPSVYFASLHDARLPLKKSNYTTHPHYSKATAAKKYGTEQNSISWCPGSVQEQVIILISLSMWYLQDKIWDERGCLVLSKVILLLAQQGEKQFKVFKGLHQNTCVGIKEP